MRDLVAKEQNARNTSTGYAIAAYDPLAAFESLTSTIPINHSHFSVHRAALLTDGAERAVSTLGVFKGWSHLTHTAAEKGPAHCLSQLRQAELLDPSGQQHPRTKFSDDATMVLWTNPAPPP